MEFAAAHFALTRPDPKTGKSRLQTLKEIRKQTGVVAPELKAMPRVPMGAEHVWRWYLALDARRTAGGFSINPITWSDLAAFFALHRLSPQPWELSAIARIDDTFIESRIGNVAGTATGAKALKQRMTGKAAT